MASQGEPRVGIKTKFLIISDTHGLEFPPYIKLPSENTIDIAIHCGDLTQHSKLEEFRATIKLLEKINASIKLVIAGNHDFSLDPEILQQKLAEAKAISSDGIDATLIMKEYGEDGAALRLLQDARDNNILFLGEGTHNIALPNGGTVKVYASPYTPNSGGDWGFQYHEKHLFAIEDDTDVVITHGPPHGIMDMTRDKKRIGCSDLFAAVAKAQPKIHCFGHVHSGWGAKLVTWRENISETPSHFTDIDNGRSRVISTLLKKKAEDLENKEILRSSYETSQCSGDNVLSRGQTLFVNAANKGDEEALTQLPWIVDVELDGSGIASDRSCKSSQVLADRVGNLKRIRDEKPELDSSLSQRKRIK